MQQTIVEIINQFGYLGIGLLIAVENLFPPIPSEVILTFGGFMTTLSDMNVWGVVIASTIGATVGAMCLFWIGRLLSAERLERFCESKLGRALRLEREDIRKAEKWFERHGKVTVFLCRFVPIVRSLISIPAGSTGMPLRAFLPLTLAGTFVWNLALVWLGRIAGNAWDTVAARFDAYSTVALAVLAVLALGAIALFYSKRAKRSARSERPS